MNVCKFVKPVPLVLTANTVPLPLVPPNFAVPYRLRLLPDKIKPPDGVAPSLLVKVPEALVRLVVKVCRFVKPKPSALTLNSVPLAAMPPALAVPYRVLPD